MPSPMTKHKQEHSHILGVIFLFYDLPSCLAKDQGYIQLFCVACFQGAQQKHEKSLRSFLSVKLSVNLPTSIRKRHLSQLYQKKESHSLSLSLSSLTKKAFDHTAHCVPRVALDDWCKSHSAQLRLFERWASSMLDAKGGVSRFRKILIQKIMAPEAKVRELFEKQKLLIGQPGDKGSMIMFGLAIVGLVAISAEDGYLVLNPVLKPAILSVYSSTNRIADRLQSKLKYPGYVLDDSNIEDDGDPDELDGFSDLSGENTPVTINHHRERTLSVSSNSPTPSYAKVQKAVVPGRSSPRRKANPPPRTLSYTVPSSPSHKGRGKAGYNNYQLLRAQRRASRGSLTSGTESPPRRQQNLNEPLPIVMQRDSRDQYHSNNCEILLNSSPPTSPEQLHRNPDTPLRNPVYQSSQTAGPSRSTNITTTIATPLPTPFSQERDLCPITVHVNAAASIPDLGYMSYYKQLQLERRQREQESHVYAYINNYYVETLAHAEKRIKELEGRLNNSCE